MSDQRGTRASRWSRRGQAEAVRTRANLLRTRIVTSPAEDQLRFVDSGAHKNPERAKQTRVLVIRANDPSKKEEVADQNTVIMPGDIIRVPERFF